MSPALEYLDRSQALVERVRAQLPEIRQAARWFAASILQDRMVHLFGSGHSRILVEEMWPRYGSFPGFNPIVELSLSFHNLVVGANGQRQAMFLENVSGLAARILRNFDITGQDCALIISSSGTSQVPVEMAEGFRQRGVKVVAIISKAHSEASPSQRADGRRLQDFAHLVLDTGAPVGDAMVTVEGLDTPVSPGSTVGGCLLVNAIKAEVAAALVKGGKPPKVLTAPAIIGREKSAELFEAAYDEHARRLAGLYQNLGRTPAPAAPAPAAAPANGGIAAAPAPVPSRRPAAPTPSPAPSVRLASPAPAARVAPAAPPPAAVPASPASPAVAPTPAPAPEPVPSTPPPLPPNWDKMDDIERRLYLRQHGAAPAPAPRGDRPERGNRPERNDNPGGSGEREGDRGPRRRRRRGGRGRGDRPDRGPRPDKGPAGTAAEPASGGDFEDDQGL